MGLFDGLGKAVGAFGETKQKAIRFSPETHNAVESLAAAVPKIRSANNSNLNLFDAATGKAINTLEGLESSDLNTLSGLAQRANQFDPVSSLERIRDGNINALTNFTSQLSGQGSRADKAAQSFLGLGGRPSSSFSDQLRTSFLSTQASPILNTIFANLGNQAGQTASDGRQNTNQILDLIDARSNVPLRVPQLHLSPIEARTRTAGAEVGLLDGLTNVARGNTAGFSAEGDFLSKLGNAFSGFDQGLNSTVQSGRGLGASGGGIDQQTLMRALQILSGSNTGNPFVFGF